jgi:hypothetical protein
MSDGLFNSKDITSSPSGKTSSAITTANDSRAELTAYSIADIPAPAITDASGEVAQLDTQDLMLFPDLQFESYLRRYERSGEPLSPKYVADLRFVRARVNVTRPDFSPFMKSGKRMRVLLIEACETLAFKPAAIEFLLSDRDRNMDATRKLRLRKDLRSASYEAFAGLRRAWDEFEVR